MKIAFVNPPADHGFMEAEDCCFAFMGRRYMPSMILACASEYDNAMFIDLTMDPPDALLDAKPDAVVYCLIPTKGYRGVHRKMSEICEGTDVKQIVISVPAGYADDLMQLDPKPFCVIYSEPEMLFRYLNGYDDLESWRDAMDGLVYKGKDMSVSRFLPNSLHKLKNMNFGLVNKEYWKGYGTVIYQVTRGCLYNCIFCTWGGSTVTDTTFRMRPADQVADDLQCLAEVAPKRGLYILSSQLTTSMKWIERFHERMKDDIYPFSSNINLHESTEEKLRLLKGSGMLSTSVGLEGLCNLVLGRMKKPHTIEDAFRVIPILEELDIKYTIHLRFGVNETRDEIVESIENFRKMSHMVKNGKFSSIGPLMYFKGTEIYEHPIMPPMSVSEVKRGFTKRGWEGECAMFPEGIEDLMLVVESFMKLVS